MPTTIYDSSLITERRKMKAQSGSFLNRTQNLNVAGYAVPLGIYDQSIINSVKGGNMLYYRKGDTGYTLISNGCPCPAINAPNVSD
jgi:hypothetical protein